MRFLIVDDHAPDRRRVTRVRQDAHRLDEAGTLADALRLIDETEGPLGQYDAILLDLDLPDSTGAATYYRMRQRVAPVPIVIYSRNQDLDVAKRLRKDGAAEYILKRAGLRGEVVLQILEIATYRERHPQGEGWDLARLLETAQDSSRRVRRAISDAPPDVRKVVEERIAELEQQLGELASASAHLARANAEQDADITQNRMRAQTAEKAAAELARRTQQVEEQVARFADLPAAEKNKMRVKHGALGGTGLLVLQALGFLLAKVVQQLLEGGSPW